MIKKTGKVNTTKVVKKVQNIMMMKKEDSKKVKKVKKLQKMKTLILTLRNLMVILTSILTLKVKTLTKKILMVNLSTNLNTRKVQNQKKKNKDSSTKKLRSFNKDSNMVKNPRNELTDFD